MRLVPLAALKALAADELGLIGERLVIAGHVAECFFRKIDQRLMLQLARSNEEQAGRRILRAQPVLEIVHSDPFQRVFASKYRPAKRLGGKGGLLQIVEHDIRRRVSRLGEFLQNHFLLKVEVLRFEVRAADQVRQELYSECE